MALDGYISSSEILRETLRAQRRIQNRLSPTPLEHSSYFSESSGANVYLKLENFQPTGSFKVRGALNSLLSLSEEQRAKGVVAASSGNHGLAVAYGASALGIGCEVFVPEHALQTKTDAIRRLVVVSDITAPTSQLQSRSRGVTRWKTTNPTYRHTTTSRSSGVRAPSPWNWVNNLTGSTQYMSASVAEV